MGLPGRQVKYVECSADGRQEFVVTAVFENPTRPFAFSRMALIGDPRYEYFSKGLKANTERSQYRRFYEPCLLRYIIP